MKKLTIAMLACGIIAGGLRNACAATMRISADNGATWTVVDDNGPLDFDPSPGSILYLGPVSGWSLTVASALGAPAVGTAITPRMDLGSTSQSAGPATLIVQMSDTNFIAFPNETFVASISAQSPGTVTYNTYRDAGNVLFGTTASSATAASLLTEGPMTGGPNYVSNSIVVPAGSGLYSLTLETIIIHRSAGFTSTDALLYPLPPPPCNCTLTFNSPASITNCADATIPDVTASEDCGNGPVPVPVTLVSLATNGVSPQVITRTYTATNDCGQGSTFVQTITVNSKPDCTITTSVSKAIAGAAGYTAWVADAGPDAIYDWTTNNAIITAGQGTTNITWTAGPDATKPATICVRVTTAAGCVSQCCTWVPLVPPCICRLTFNSPASITNCDGESIPDVTASQDCGAGPVSVPVTLVSLVTNGVCPQIITRTYAATNDCGKAYGFVQTVTINCKPDCTITPSVTTAMIGTSNYTATVADAGPGATYNWSVLNGTIVSGQGTTKLTWNPGTDTNSPISIVITITAATGCQSTCSASVKLTPQPPKIALGHGDTATIGFWHNKNGQGLILNASNSPALANWLASNFPCLYGGLAGKPNSTVASLFLTYFNVKGAKSDAQVLAGALACYFTTPSLGGGPGPQMFGFNQSPGGTGSKTFNVGLNGTILGLQNNTSYTVTQILQAANNAKCNPAVNQAALAAALNTIFDAINQGGDIT